MRSYYLCSSTFLVLSDTETLVVEDDAGCMGVSPSYDSRRGCGMVEGGANIGGRDGGIGAADTS